MVCPGHATGYRRCAGPGSMGPPSTWPCTAPGAPPTVLTTPDGHRGTGHGHGGGRYPHERGDQAAVEVAQFRQFRPQDGGQHGPHPGHTLQAGGLALPVGMGRGFIPPWRVHLDQGLRPRDPMPSILMTWQRWGQGSRKDTPPRHDKAALPTIGRGPPPTASAVLAMSLGNSKKPRATWLPPSCEACQ